MPKSIYRYLYVSIPRFYPLYSSIVISSSYKDDEDEDITEQSSANHSFLDIFGSYAVFGLGFSIIAFIFIIIFGIYSLIKHRNSKNNSDKEKSQNELSISRGKNLVGDGCLEYSNRIDISKTFTEKGKSLASGVKQAVDNQIELHDVREKKRQVIIKLSNMTKLLRNARVDKEVKLSSNDIDNIAWDNQLLEEIKTEALDIVSICRYLEGGQ